MEYRLGDTPVHITGLHIPETTHGVRVTVEPYGPLDTQMCQQFGVYSQELESFAVFKSIDSSPIGFALIEAAKATGKRIEHVSGVVPVEGLTFFDMPMRFLEAIKITVKALHDAGYDVFLDPDFAQALRSHHLNETTIVEVKDKIDIEERRQL